MPEIKKATIKSYDAANHKADVQIAGSLGVWLDGIRVATDIPAADIVAGRQCTVLFLDPSNQDDALVLTVQGALPSGGGGGTTDHGALTGLGDDDHTQYQKESEKGAASGYASLDATTKVPTAELGGSGASSSKYLRGDQSWQAPPDTQPLIAGAMVPGSLTVATEPPHVPAYYTGTAVEINLRYTSGSATAVTVTVKHYDGDGVQQNSQQIAMGSNKVASANINWAVSKNDYFECVVDTVAGGSPKDLVWQVRP